MKVKKEDIPVVMRAPDTVMRAQRNLGDMTVSFHDLPAGTDLTPVLKGLRNDSCQCPHWGYILKGVMRFVYDDGREERLEAGDVFYAPAGHTALVDEDLQIVDFSPTRELDEVLAHVGKKMAEATA
jgi:hypothetical protein